MKLINQKRHGLLPHDDGVAPNVKEVRATIPAVEALRAAGATVEPLPPPGYGYRVTLGATMPSGIVAVYLQDRGIGLRLKTEPEYPQERLQVDWTR